MKALCMTTSTRMNICQTNAPGAGIDSGGPPRLVVQGSDGNGCALSMIG